MPTVVAGAAAGETEAVARAIKLTPIGCEVVDCGAVSHISLNLWEGWIQCDIETVHPQLI